MCRVGKRCATHIRENYKKQQEAEELWASEVSVRRTQVAASPNRRTRQSLRVAEGALAKAKEKVEAARAEHQEQEDREAKIVKPQGNGQLTDFAATLFKGEEWEGLANEAAGRGISRSELIRERLGQLPRITARTASPRPPVETKTHGRQPTDGTEGIYRRETRGVRIPPEVLVRLDAEASLFGLSRSDYTRALVLELDPRRLGNHVGSSNAQTIAEQLQAHEAANNVTAADAASYWQEQVQDIRRRKQR
jgi:hypothetical protein